MPVRKFTHDLKIYNIIKIHLKFFTVVFVGGPVVIDHSIIWICYRIMLPNNMRTQAREECSIAVGVTVPEETKDLMLGKVIKKVRV